MVRFSKPIVPLCPVNWKDNVVVETDGSVLIVAPFIWELAPVSA